MIPFENAIELIKAHHLTGGTWPIRFTNYVPGLYRYLHLHRYPVSQHWTFWEWIENGQGYVIKVWGVNK